MDVVIDASALIAVIVGEPERHQIDAHTIGNALIGLGSIPRDIGNAFSTLVRQNRLTPDEAKNGLAIFDNFPLRYGKTDFVNA